MHAGAIRNGKPKKTSEDRYFSRSVAKALDALEQLGRSGRPLSLQELTARLGGAKTSLFRFLRTLEAAGYVVRGEHGLYSLPADQRSAAPAHFISRLVRTAEPLLRDLVREFRETASVAALFDNHIEVVLVVDSPQMIRMSNVAGRIIPPHASSLGKCITAFQSEDRRENLLRSYGIHQFTPHTMTDERQLRAAFERIRDQGHATEREESHLQGCCFGVPLLNEDGAAFAAISISMPVMRFEGEAQQARYVASLKCAAAAISTNLQGDSSLEGEPVEAAPVG